MIDRYRDPIWEIMDMFSRPYERNKLSDNGLKEVIKRPHNLANIHAEDGQVIAQRLDVVTTPFKKEDVKLTVSDNILTVTCGNENIKDDANETVLFRGISSQTYTFSLTLAPTVDLQKITAENKDGILKIVLPLKVLQPKTPEQIEINIV